MISADGSPIMIAVVPTNEELAIARRPPPCWSPGPTDDARNSLSQLSLTKPTST